MSFFSSDGLVKRSLEYASTLEHIMDFTRLRALGSLFSMIKQAVRNIHQYNHSHNDFPMQVCWNYIFSSRKQELLKYFSIFRFLSPFHFSHVTSSNFHQILAIYHIYIYKSTIDKFSIIFPDYFFDFFGFFRIFSTFFIFFYNFEFSNIF